MSQYQKQAELLMQTLQLPQPAIAIAFTDKLPEGMPEFDTTVAAGCRFWQEAATGCFATSASDHELCSIGVHTHNLSDASAAQPQELQTALSAMIGLDYVRESEIAAIPVMPVASRYAIYGPLAEFPLVPQVVMLFADAEQGLILSEAVARVDANLPPAMGRPACAVIPQVINQGRAAMSLGCCGARAYLDGLTSGIALWALPGDKLDLYCEQIRLLGNANTMLSKFHQLRRDDVARGQRPSVDESLQQLS